MVELYYNSNQYRHILKVLLESFERPFVMYEALAAFYEREGYFVNQPARMYRYQVLLKFAMETAPQKEDLWRELFTYDAYLRENLKARPDFAKDLSAYRDSLRRLGNANKGNHIEVFSYPIWTMDEGCSLDKLKKMEKEQFVCFHYEERSPLTREARVELVEDLDCL